MDDRRILDEVVGIGAKSPISGPWRLTVWDSPTTGKLYVFSEEHANKGSCPQNRHFSLLASEILQKTRGVHMLVENFIHANEITTPKTGTNTSMAQACSPVNMGILNNLRSCLEVMRINSHHCPEGCAKRIHFIDPRVDMVSVLPDGKLFEAISFYAEHKAAQGAFDDAVLIVFESLIHPLSSLLPDRKNLTGRLVGVFEAFRTKMTPVQTRTFDKVWVRDITGGIGAINAKYVKLHETYSASRRNTQPSLASFSREVEEIKQMYKRYTNSFMDVWLLAHVFMIQNTVGSSGMVMYLGSLHGLEIEKHLSLHGLRKVYHSESQNLDSCLPLT
ncbi:unnamed protein product [Ectocarpus sp. 12 AP-2014]